MMQEANGGAEEALRIVYWGPQDTGKTTSLECIAKSADVEGECSLSRIRTRLDPTTCYEELELFFAQPGARRRKLVLVAVPGSPDLGPIRLQLLDQIDAAVILLDPRAENEAANRASLNELRANLAAYGKKWDELPVAIQFRPADAKTSASREARIRALDISPLGLFETSSADPRSFLEPLKALVPAMDARPDAPEIETASPEAPGLISPHEASPWSELPPANDSSAEEAVMKALLEDSILAEAEMGEPAEIPIDSLFDMTPLGDEEVAPSPAPALVGPDPEIISVGSAERTGKSGVRVPLELRDSRGDPVPFTLHIELEAGPDGSGTDPFDQD
jgi:mutual gliding-motility protein MglA